MIQSTAGDKVPIVLILLGAALWTLAALMGQGVVIGGPRIQLTVADLAVINFVLLFAVAHITALTLRVSFGDFKSAIVKLAAIALFPGAVGHFIPVVGWLISFALYFFLLVGLFELEVYQAVIFSLVLSAIRLVILAIIAFENIGK